MSSGEAMHQHILPVGKLGTDKGKEWFVVIAYAWCWFRHSPSKKINKAYTNENEQGAVRTCVY